MTPYYESDRTAVYHGDNRAILPTLVPESLDAVVTDPPYELGFMGKRWDGTGIACDPSFWLEVLRVLKPGGHLVAFGGTRTFHRMTCAIEDAGFEIRDCLSWLYGSGFPKSLDVSKQIDKMAGADREVIREGAPVKRMIPGADQNSTGSWIKDNGRLYVPTETAPATDEAARWDGWGTALKPAWEPIVLARKPLSAANVASNVLVFGTGAINVDGCRIESSGRPMRDVAPLRDDVEYHGNALAGRLDGSLRSSVATGTTDTGRWPANVVLDEDAAALLDEQSGDLTSGANPSRRGSDKFRGVYAAFEGQAECTPARGTDRGGASRFFYTAKASASERRGSTHPTVKPLALMRWLCRLVTPPDGVILDPFAGSGTTVEAALQEGFRVVAIEMMDEYLPDLARRSSTQLGFSA